MTSAVIASCVAFLGVLVTIAVNGARANRDRKREMFSRAMAAVADYCEFPYVVRRRRHDDGPAERVRISESLRVVQKEIAFHQAWIRTEDEMVADKYDALVDATRRIVGMQIHSAWLQPPARSDADMNIADIDLRDISGPRTDYLGAVRASLAWRRS